ncbi:MAG: flagellar biosynthesis protein FliQ [Deltaproteobacteria bacterium]|nr:flagellar biosynthesis protein FliQ [Candidatus Anaeroferrophillus wilburensis]MBN2889588.1 flagellar biosynthesis protein FliQ [Deltaproteobacteria bacterium]
MTADFVVGFAKQALETTLLISAPMLGFGLVVGLLVSIFQAVTSIQEMTLTFIPKILAVFLAIIIFFPWMLRYLVDFTVRLLASIPSIVG